MEGKEDRWRARRTDGEVGGLTDQRSQGAVRDGGREPDNDQVLILT